MSKVTLKFPDMGQLSEFLEVTKTVNYGVNHTTFTLICQLSEADIDLAREGFHAEVVELQ